MKNEEKAKEIAIELMDGDDRNIQPLVGALVEMVQWKDEQLKMVCKNCEQHIINSGKMGCAFRSLSNEYCWEV